jgi:hypothetical protein
MLMTDGFSTGFNDEVPTMIKPGAGLTQLDLGLDNTDSLFDSIFTTCVRQPGIDIPRQTGSVRRYHSDDDLYVFSIARSYVL